MDSAVYILNTPLPDAIASIRVGALIPARQIGLRALYFGPKMDPVVFLDRHRPSTLILTKAFDHSVVDLAHAAASRDIAVITTLCDLHFAGEKGQRNRQLCAMSKAVVVQTKPMADEVMRQFGMHCTIIEEAIEYPREPSVPSAETPDKIVKGHNRVIEAINAGRVAITYPVPQYRELADYSFCDADYGASIRAARADPDAALMKLERGQHYIDTRFAADVVADKWRRLLERLYVTVR
jgi:hypothetical protein